MVEHDRLAQANPTRGLITRDQIRSSFRLLLFFTFRLPSSSYTPLYYTTLGTPCQVFFYTGSDLPSAPFRLRSHPTSDPIVKAAAANLIYGPSKKQQQPHPNYDRTSSSRKPTSPRTRLSSSRKHHSNAALQQLHPQMKK